MSVLSQRLGTQRVRDELFQDPSEGALLLLEQRTKRAVAPVSSLLQSDRVLHKAIPGGQGGNMMGAS